ncbi:HPr-rel-A system PqqD family peptide chaperone [Magnetococcales bacterium HHB-1]
MTPTRWQASGFHQLKVEPLMEQFAIYDPRSGSSHLINALSMEILEQLAYTPRSVHHIIEALQIGDIDPRTEKTILKLLHHLDQLGLIEQAEP